MFGISKSFLMKFTKDQDCDFFVMVLGIFEQKGEVFF